MTVAAPATGNTPNSFEPRRPELRLRRWTGWSRGGARGVPLFDRFRQIALISHLLRRTECILTQRLTFFHRSIKIDQGVPSIIIRDSWAKICTRYWR